MVLGRTDVAFCEVRSVVMGGNVLYYTRGNTVTEELKYRFGRLVVGYKVGNSMVVCFEILECTTKSFDVRGAGFGWHRFEVCISLEDSD